MAIGLAVWDICHRTTVGGGIIQYMLSAVLRLLYCTLRVFRSDGKRKMGRCAVESRHVRRLMRVYDVQGFRYVPSV